MAEGLEKETALVEAILYMESEPVDEGALSRFSGLAKDIVKEALENLEYRYNAEDSGLELSRIGGGVMISPKKAYWDNLKERYGKKNESRISRAVMETLSIIAYRQPVTRAEIKSIRGPDPDAAIRLLLEKELIREDGKKDVPGKPVQYGTTKEFLKIFRLNSIADLPKLSEGDLDRFELVGSADRIGAERDPPLAASTGETETAGASPLVTSTGESETAGDTSPVTSTGESETAGASPPVTSTGESETAEGSPLVGERAD